MISVNLIPTHRRNARRRRVRVRRWAAVCVAYALVLFVSYGVCRAVWDAGHDLVRELDEVTEQIDQSNQAIAALGPEMAQARLTLDASQGIVDQPDWSVLLALMAKTLGDEIVLKSCRLQRRTDARAEARRPDGAPAQPAGEMPEAFTVALSGYGQSPQAVSRFVLRLERTGLFEQVKVRATNREPFLATDAIAFQIEGTLAEKGGAAR